MYIYSACEADVYYIGRVGTLQEGLAGLTNSPFESVLVLLCMKTASSSSWGGSPKSF